MKKIPPLTKKRRSLADLSPDSLAAALYHRELASQDQQLELPKAKTTESANIQQQPGNIALPKHSKQ